MKKALALLLIAIMSLTLFTGCEPSVYDDLENFINVEMVEVNKNYEKITAEAKTWEELEDEDAIETSLKDVLIPLVDNSLENLEKINPQTEEVTNLKNKYVAVMKAYKEGFEKILEGFLNADESIMLEGNDKVNEGIKLLEEYNTALEALAKEVDAKIEY